MKTPPSSTSARRSFSAGSSEAYCALTSTSGIWGTAAQSRRADPADYEIRHDQHDRGGNGVLDEAEVAMEALPARPEAPASPGKTEAPGNATEERENGEARDRHSRNPGRDRDERADDRRHPAEEDRGVPVALEPAVGSIELRGCQMQPPAVALEVRPAAVVPDPPAQQRSNRVTDHARERESDEGPEM